MHQTSTVISRCCARCKIPLWPYGERTMCSACQAIEDEDTPIYDEVAWDLWTGRVQERVDEQIRHGLSADEGQRTLNQVQTWRAKYR